MVVAVEVEDVEAWDRELSAVTQGLEWLFARPEPKQTFGLWVRTLLADVAKKNCWGDVGVRRAYRARNGSSTC